MLLVGDERKERQAREGTCRPMDGILRRNLMVRHNRTGERLGIICTSAMEKKGRARIVFVGLIGAQNTRRGN